VVFSINSYIIAKAKITGGVALMVNRRQIIIKLVLIFVAEAIAMSINLWVHEHIYAFKYPVAANVILGATLAVLVVALYNQLLLRRKQIVERELHELTRVVLKRLPEKPEDMKRR
jgi:membrane protein YdbS with pleckstrin-like domain